MYTAPSFENPQAIFDGSAGIATGQNQSSAKQKNSFHRGLKLVINISAISGGCTLTVTIRGYDPISGNAFTILASAALNATGTTTLSVYPGGPVTANVSVNDVLPPTWDVNIVTAVGGSVTFTVGEIKLT